MQIASQTWRIVLSIWFASLGAIAVSMAVEPLVRTVDLTMPSSISADVSSKISSATSPTTAIVPPASAKSETSDTPVEVAGRARASRKTHRRAIRTPEAVLRASAEKPGMTASLGSSRKSIQLASASENAGAHESVQLIHTETESTRGFPSLTRSVKGAANWISSARKTLADRAGISIHGLLNFGTNFNFNQPATGNNLYRVFDYFGASSFEPNQAELYINRTVSNQPGFVIDLNFLNTAEVMHGITSYYGDQPGPQNPTGWMDPTQVYLTYTVPIGSGLNLQAGKYTSLIGYEYIPTWNNTNFNQSIDLLYSLGEPFTVTGIRANYAFNKYAAATLGVNDGWDTIATRNVLQTLEAQLSLTPTESITWNMQGMFGPSTGTQSGSKRGLANTTLMWKTPYKPLQVGFEYLFVDQSAPVLFTPLAEGPAYTNPLQSPSAQPIRHSVWWSGAGFWAAYNLTDSVQLATRGEWFDDPSGARSGIEQNLGELTETLNYTIPVISGLTARLEYRHDFSSAHPFPNAGPIVNFPCLAGICTSTTHTYSGQDTFETALLLTF
jgi:hypothetical protein